MRLTPREIDKLLLHGAGFLAQKRLARGLRLSYPEAVALIATQLLEFIREGRSLDEASPISVAELMDVGRRLLGRAQVMQGVAEMIHEVQVEGTFADGTKLVTVHHPIVTEHGDLDLALYGSFLPVPDPTIFQAPDPSETPAGTDTIAGELFVGADDIVLNAGCEELTLEVVNQGDRPIQVGSHFPIAEANRALSFDRDRAIGMRLDIPAGTAVRFEPGDRKTVRLVRTQPTSEDSESATFSSTKGATS